MSGREEITILTEFDIINHINYIINKVKFIIIIQVIIIHIINKTKFIIIIQVIKINFNN